MMMAETFFVDTLLTSLNLLLLIAWIVMGIIALIKLRNRMLPPTAKAIWTLVVLIPILGAIAFFIVHPTDSNTSS
jgi:hypothetical protein